MAPLRTTQEERDEFRAEVRKESARRQTVTIPVEAALCLLDDADLAGSLIRDGRLSIADQPGSSAREGEEVPASGDPSRAAPAALAEETERAVASGHAGPTFWEPIETAPKDGTEIIVTDGASVHGSAWWHPLEEAWLDCGGIFPTHWQPLPPAPPIPGDAP